MFGRTLRLPVLIAVAVVAACAAALMATSHEAEAAFPGKNGGIVFQSFRGWDEPSSLYSRDPETGAFTRLTDNDGSGFRDDYPDVSPDGNRVVFVRTRDFDDSTRDLYTVGSDGTRLERLTDDPDLVESGPTWSPGGRRVAFDAYPADDYGDYEVYIVDADGSGRKQITDNDLDERGLAWSPDGAKLAFTVYGNQGPPGVYVMDSDGSGATRLAEGSEPSWSPDGSRIAFACGPFGDRAICTMNPDGSDQQRIATDRFEDNPGIEAVRDGAPDWSPDGKRIAFAREIDFDSGDYGNSVYTMDTDGSDLQIVAGYFPRAIDPAWGPAPTPDDAKPTVTRPYPAPGGEIRDRTPTVGAIVSDRITNLAKADMKLYLDGAPKTFSYDRATDRLSRTTGKLSYGQHRVKVVAKDAAGNATTKAWSFRVVGRR